MATYYEKKLERTKEDADGNVTVETTLEQKSIVKNEEPDYIKLYTRMWCEFNQIPEKWRPLFLALVCRMTYASLDSSTGGQIVYTVGPNAQDIMAECGWKTKDPLYRGLKALSDCDAIHQVARGAYQISPHYAGRGTWRYNANLKQGGVKDLIAKFDFVNHTVDTEVEWSSTDKHEIGDADQVVATKTVITPNDSAAVAAATDIEVSDDTQQTTEPKKRRKKTA